MKLDLGINFRISELSEEHQLAIARFVNHMASESYEWSESRIKKLKEITYEK